MSIKKPRGTPSFRHHKASVQGFVEINGCRIYLGRFDLPATHEKYHRVIADWHANGGEIPANAESIRVAESIGSVRVGAEQRRSATPGGTVSGTTTPGRGEHTTLPWTLWPVTESPMR